MLCFKVPWLWTFSIVIQIKLAAFLLIDEIEEELAPLIEAQEVKHVETYEEQLQKTKDAATDLSWIQFLGSYLPLTTLFLITL